MVVNLAGRLRSLEAWRTSSGNLAPRWFVSVKCVDVGWNEHEAGTISDWGNGCGLLLVPAAFEADPVAGLSARQSAWLRTGDRVHVDVVVESDDRSSAIYGYSFAWPHDPGKPEPPEPAWKASNLRAAPVPRDDTRQRVSGRRKPPAVETVILKSAEEEDEPLWE